MPKDFIVGDPVVAFGLVGAAHLNRKQGMVKRTKDTQGRVAVEFVGEEALKLVKQSNLKIERVPDDKNDPRICISFEKDGRTEKARVLIENGAGRTSVDCSSDLEGKYHFDLDGDFICEECFMARYYPDPLVHRYCAVCHEYVSVRQQYPLFLGPLRKLYPNGLLPNGRPCECAASPCVAWTHGSCGRCATLSVD